MPHSGAMAVDNRPWWRNQTWGFGTLLGGAVLGLLIGASGGAATMALVADGTDAPGNSGDHRADEGNRPEHAGQGHAFGHDKGHRGGDDKADRDDKRDKRQKAEKSSRPGKAAGHGPGDAPWAMGLEQGMAHGHGPDGQGPPGLVKKR